MDTVAEIRIRGASGADEYPRLVQIWRTAVDATHDFLLDEDRDAIERALPVEYLPMVRLFVATVDDRVVGFAGVAGVSLEMLFIDAEQRGQGVGSALLDHVVTKYAVTELEVNEQNPQATGFYHRHGFVVVGRSDLDAQGRPYPLLRMSLHPDDPATGAGGL